MKQPSKRAQALGLVGWLAGSFVTAAIGALATARAEAFYDQLSQPVWAPPGWLFGPVWTLLYTLMGLAAWLIWRQHGFRGAAVALSLFIAQLCANAFWSWLFFAWQQGAGALVEIVVLWLLIAATLGAFWRLDRRAALLLAPYLAWVTFATALNYALWRLNPGVLG